MFQVEIYGRVRRAVRVEGRSQRAVAREFGLSRETVRKMLQYAVPPGYQRQQPIKRPKLGPWLGVIDAILEDDKQRPAKQRHTAKRIFERLREEQRMVAIPKQFGKDINLITALGEMKGAPILRNEKMMISLNTSLADE